MSEKKVKTVTISQVHDALEERQNPDRRKQSHGIPEHVNQERRKGPRRGGDDGGKA